MGLNANRKKFSKAVGNKAKSAKDKIGGAAKATKKTAPKIAKKTKDTVSTNAKKASMAISQKKYERDEKKLHPLFLEEYQGENFDMPKLIVIADEDSRKGIEMCKGSIGWLNTNKVPEIMFMYEEFVPKSKIEFYPRPICGGSYYRHPFENNLYLQVKDYLHTCKANQLTELKNIASYLGATSCSVEIHEDKNIVKTIKASANAKKSVKASKKASGSVNVNASGKVDSRMSESLSIVMSETFEPSDNPKRPPLLWFANDYEILSLIEKRCNPEVGGKLNSYSVDITSSTSSTLSLDFAGKIDASLKFAKVKAGASLSSKVKEDEKKRFYYNIEF